MKFVWKALVALLGIAASLPGFAQTYPDKPIKIYHGITAGGGADLLLRTLLPQLSEHLCQQAVVEHRPGAAGNVAMDAVARAAPFGYTLLMATPANALNPTLDAN